VVRRHAFVLSGVIQREETRRHGGDSRNKIEREEKLIHGWLSSHQRETGKGDQINRQRGGQHRTPIICGEVIQIGNFKRDHDDEDRCGELKGQRGHSGVFGKLRKNFRYKGKADGEKQYGRQKCPRMPVQPTDGFVVTIGVSLSELPVCLDHHINMDDP